MFFLLFFLWNLFFSNGDLALCSQGSFCKFLNFFRVLTLYFFHFLIFLLIDLFHCLSMLFLKPFNGFECIFLNLSLTFDFLLIIFLDFSQLFFIFALIPYDLFLEQFWLLFLRSFKLVILCALLHYIFCLVGIILL